MSQRQSCEAVGITPRTLQNWRHAPDGDGRLDRSNFTSPRQIPEDLREQIVDRFCKADVRDLSLTQAFYKLLDENKEYWCSLSTLYRLFRARGLNARRAPTREARRRSKPTAYSAEKPNEVWTWDITYLRSSKYTGRFYYAYVIVDVYSRMVVSARVFEADNADFAVRFLGDAFRRYGIKPGQLVVHSDNGASMKAAPTLALLEKNGITFSHSRPRVSNDNPYSESFFRTLKYTSMNVIVPDAHGDWFNQRDDSFSRFIQIGEKTLSDSSLFTKPIVGVCTNRDAWVYNSSLRQLERNLTRSINAFYKARSIFENSTLKEPKDRVTEAREFVKGEISWSRGLLNKLIKKRLVQPFNSEKILTAIYRPFIQQYLYYDRDAFVEMPGKWSKAFPKKTSDNLVICSSGVDNLVICINQNAKDAGQIALMTDHIADLHFNGDTQCFPRWLPGEQSKAAEDTLDFGEPSEMPSGFSQEALPHFQAAYPGKPITEDDLFYYIYGILHSEDYRTRYANNLMKELPRIPRVATYEQFMAFVEAGQELARLHVHFEDVAPYAGVKIEYTKVGQPSYRVTQMKWGKIKGKTGNAAKDKTTLIYNDWITVKNIPLEAQEYVVNKKSALDWVVERACVSIDKASGIVNDFNDYAAEMGSERYPLDLFLKVITVSLETMKIVKALPKLEIHQLDKEASVD